MTIGYATQDSHLQLHILPLNHGIVNLNMMENWALIPVGIQVREKKR